MQFDFALVEYLAYRFCLAHPKARYGSVEVEALSQTIPGFPTFYNLKCKVGRK